MENAGVSVVVGDGNAEPRTVNGRGERGERGERTYTKDCIVLIRCSHIREMKGETDEVVRRTRDVAAENAVINAVRKCGIEPDWFVERWDEERDFGSGKGNLIACAVFEEKSGIDVKRFETAVSEEGERVRKELEKVDGKVKSPVEIVEDDGLKEEVAEYFTAQLRKEREERAWEYRTVIEDARKGGKYWKRVICGEYEVEGEEGGKDLERSKAAFDEVRKAMEDANDAEKGEGIAYSGYWDGNVARFCFGFKDAERCADAMMRLDGIGARTYDPMDEGEEMPEGEELEMTALVVARMQVMEAERDMMEKAMGSVKNGVEEGMKEAGDVAKGLEKVFD